MVEEGPKDKEVHNRRMEHQKLQGLQRPEPELLAHAGDGIVRLSEVEVDLGNILSDDLDLGGPTHAQTLLMGDANALDIHGVEAHHLGGDGMPDPVMPSKTPEPSRPPMDPPMTVQTLETTNSFVSLRFLSRRGAQGGAGFSGEVNGYKIGRGIQVVLTGFINNAKVPLSFCFGIR